MTDLNNMNPNGTPLPQPGQPGVPQPGVPVPPTPQPGAPVPPAPVQSAAVPPQHAPQAMPVLQQPSRQQPMGAMPVPPQHAQKPGKKGTGKTFWLGFAGAAVACAVGLGCFGIWQSGALSANAASVDTPKPTPQLQQNSSITASPEDLTLPEQVAEKCLPSVAAIDVYTDSSSMYAMYGMSGGDGELIASSLGSGVVLTEDGYIVTNYHVVQGADAVTVTVEGTQYDADIIGTDPSSDLAVVKARDAKGLTPMDLGDSDNLIIGEWVMSIGSPFGLEQSVATGIVSATSRSQTMAAETDAYGNATGETMVYANMIQTDAAINPGNSGGALVNSDGALIGINTLITSYSGNYSGVGFAIPVNYAVNIAQQIIDGKTPTHAQLGVSLSTVTPQIAQRYGLSVTSGAYIAAVSPDSGAAEAGLQVGDIVTAFDGKAVESADDLMLDVRGQNPGDTITLTVNRDGQTSDIQVTLGSDEASQAAAAAAQQQTPQQGQGQGGNGGSLEDLFGNRR